MENHQNIAMTENVIPISEIEFDPQNARKRTERSSYLIRESLQQYGPLRSLVGQRLPDGRIIVRAGNGTLEEAGQIGIDKVRVIERRPDELVVVVADDLDEKQWKQYAVVDNRSSDLSSWDLEALEELAEEVDLSICFHDGELNKLMESLQEVVEEEPEKGLTDPDDIPDEDDVETRVKCGEVWQLGRHRIMCGDSTCKADVERLMDGTIAEFCFTSPPYSAMRQYEEGTDISISYLSKIFGVWLNNCNYFVINLGLQFKDGEVVQYWDEWIKAAKDEGLKLLAWNVWDKQQMGSISSATNMFGLTHEWLFVFGESRKRLNRTVPNQLEKYASRHGEDFLEGISRKAREFDGSISVATSKAYTHHQIHSVIQVYSELSNVRDLHPATMPVGLPEQYIEAMTDNTQSVVDCFLSSGSTLIACEKTVRTCYGMELSEKYCDVIIQRWEDFTGGTAVLVS